MKIHILRFGTALCGFSNSTPDRWPEGHVWISRSEEIPHDLDGNEVCRRCLDKEKQRDVNPTGRAPFGWHV